MGPVRRCLCALTLLAGLLGAAPPALAQQVAPPFPARLTAPVNLDTAVARATLQTLSQLPPVTNVGYGFEYDPDLGTFVRSRQGLASGMVPMARFNREGGFAGIVSFAYFNLNQFNGEDSSSFAMRPLGAPGNVAVGVSTRVATEVYAVRLAGRYTLLEKWDIGFSVPLLTVRTASQFRSQAIRPAQVPSFLAQGTNFPVNGNTLINAPLNQVDFPGSFNEGWNFDVGNVTLDTKWGLPIDSDEFAAGILGEVRLPTGSQDRFTGSDSTGLRVLLLASWQGEQFGAAFAGGYEQDFTTDVLSNGSVAASVSYRPAQVVLFELGMNANFYLQDLSLYNLGAIRGAFPGIQIFNDTGLGTNEVNFGGGARYNLFDDVVLSAYGSFPVTDDGYRPEWVGSVSVDYAF